MRNEIEKSVCRIAILGCGYVADYYMATLSAHPDLTLVGAYDIDQSRLSAFSAHHDTRAFSSYEEMLADSSIEIILNLTNPRAHFETTKAALDAGKHVYSEKPIAMTADKAAELATIAKNKDLHLCSAPCSLLGATAQTLWKAVNDGMVGKVRLVYASFDDGMVPKMSPESWRSVSGAQWPIKDEYEIGCTYEHAAYVMSWLAAIFGPAKQVQSFATVCLPEKGITVDNMAPDFTNGIVQYDNDVVARVTCSIVAPIDKSITIVGENGILYTKYVRNDASPVYFRPTPPERMRAGVANRLSAIKLKAEQTLRLPFSLSGLSLEDKVPFAISPAFKSAGGGNLLRSGGNKPVDFLRGTADMADAIRSGRAPRLSADLGVHMVELIEKLQHPERFDPVHQMKTSFDSIKPLDWN